MASQIVIVASAAELTSRWPSGLKATLRIESACPERVRSSWPDTASHSFTVLSTEALARLPFGWQLPCESAPLRKSSQFEEGFIGSAEQTENVAPSGRGTFDKTQKNETAGSQTMGIEWTAAFSPNRVRQELKFLI